jgi:hypothetical protein
MADQPDKVVQGMVTVNLPSTVMALLAEVFLHENRLIMLDDMIEQKKSATFDLLKKTSDLKSSDAMKFDSADHPDEVEELEKVEV